MKVKETYFDKAAKSYDATFSNSTIGKRQRMRVRKYMKKVLYSNHIEYVLEINCGTGEDAIWLSSFDEIQIYATDVSTEMIHVAKSKKSEKSSNLSFAVADIQNIADQYHSTDYRLVFSNFGGLNCLDKEAFKTFLHDIKKILKPHAHLVMVIMPKKTFVEKIYRLVKNEFKVYKDRASAKGLSIDVNGSKVQTYFYNKAEIEGMANGFCCEAAFPIGFIPSYFESKAIKFKRLFNFLFKIESLFLRVKFLYNYADHYLIHLKLK